MTRPISTHQKTCRSMLGCGALCIVLLLSGCGGGSDGNASTPLTPPTPPAPTNPGGGTATPVLCAVSQCAPVP